MQFVMHVDRRLEYGSVAILTRRIVAGKIGTTELLPRLPRLTKSKFADEVVKLTDTEYVSSTGRPCLR